jgi:predicted MFS family arabinose efflux permease
MIACDWLRAIVLATIPLAALFDVLTFSQLMVSAALMAAASTFFDVADRSMLPSLVDRHQIVDANRGLTAGKTVAEASGFAASGWLVQLLTAPGAIVVDAATFVWSALTLRRIERVESRPPEEAGERAQIAREIVQGLGFVRRHAVLVPVAVSIFLLSVSIQIIGAVYLLYVNQELGFSPGVLGVIFAMGGLFSLLASLVAGRALTIFGVGPLLIGSVVLLALGQSLTALATGVTLFAVAAMLLQQAMDLPWSLYEITQVSTRQAMTPDAWLGRMNGSFHAVEFGGYLLGSVAGGWLGTEVGLRATILVGAVGILAAALPIVFSPVRTLRALPSSLEGSA